MPPAWPEWLRVASVYLLALLLLVVIADLARGVRFTVVPLLLIVAFGVTLAAKIWQPKR